MKQNKQKSNWIIDAVLFGAFLLALWLDLTGLAVHQLLGVGVAVLAGYHLVVHWSWVKAVTGRFFGRTSNQSRLFYVVDASLVVGFLTILATGLVISTWLNLALASFTLWLNIHIMASIVTLILLVVKIGVHWRWIISVARRYIFPARSPARPTTPVQPAPATSPLSRREFMRLMAGVGAVAALAGVNALGGLAANQVAASAATPAASSTLAQSTENAQTQSATSTTTASTSCTVRCQNRCSFPGRCHRYVDSNGNGRCDLGECQS